MKQETLEEAAKHNYPICDDWNYGQAMVRRLAFVKGAEWMKERMYSEDEVLRLCNLIKNNERQWDLFDKGIIKNKPKSYDEFIDKFKKK